MFYANLYLLQNERTALMLASDKGHTDVVRELVEAGANLNLVDVVRNIWTIVHVK